MDDIRLISATSPSSSSILKPVCSPLTGVSLKTDSTSLIQQSDVSSSRPALLAHDALGPLLFEVSQFSFKLNKSVDLSRKYVYLYIYERTNATGFSLFFFFCFCVLKEWR
jgi:hypothetical protein